MLFPTLPIRPTFSIRFVTAVLSFALLLTISEPSLAVDADLAKLIEQAKSDFQPISAEEVAAAQANLIGSAAQFEQALATGSRRAEEWKRYLKWEGVQQALSQPGAASPKLLRDSLDKFRSGADGVELPIFRRVASDLQRYADLLAMEQLSQRQDFASKLLDDLSKYLDRYEANPTSRARFEIERRLDLLSSLGRVPQLTAAIRNQFNHPNVCLELSEQFLSRVATKPINDVGPVNDCILGTTIRGMGNTTGMVTLETVPSDDRALLMLRLEGTTLSETKGYKKPVVIRSSGTTHFTATKQIALEDADFWNYPTQVHATTSTHTRSVQKQGGGFGSRFIETIGTKKVAEKKPQANAIAADHAEVRIADGLEEELLPKLQNARFQYQNKFKKALQQHGAEPTWVAFSTTDHSLNVNILQTGRGQLGAETRSPDFSVVSDLSLQLHETGASNLASAMLAGATLSQQTRDGHPALNVELPSWLRDAIDEAREEQEAKQPTDAGRHFKPWSIRFRRLRPVTIEFAENRVNIRLHAAQISAGDDSYNGWDILVSYTLQPQEGGLQLARTGEIEVIPTRFDPAGGKGLTNKQVALRGNLAKELNRQAEAGRGFPSTIDIKPLQLPSKIAQHGPLLLEEATSKGGWLSLGWLLP